MLPMLSLIVLSFASNVDNIGVGITYGLGKKHIPYIVQVLSVIGGITSGTVNWLSSWLSPVLPDFLLGWMAEVTLVIIGWRWVYPGPKDPLRIPVGKGMVVFVRGVVFEQLRDQDWPVTSIHQHQFLDPAGIIRDHHLVAIGFELYAYSLPFFQTMRSSEWERMREDAIVQQRSALSEG